MPEATVWDDVLADIRTRLDPEDFRRWFAATAYASDSGDQITVWVGSEAIRRHLVNHLRDDIDAALEAIGRPGTFIRFVVAGFDDDEDDEP